MEFRRESELGDCCQCRRDSVVFRQIFRQVFGSRFVGSGNLFEFLSSFARILAIPGREGVRNTLVPGSELDTPLLENFVSYHVR